MQVRKKIRVRPSCCRVAYCQVAVIEHTGVSLCGCSVLLDRGGCVVSTNVVQEVQALEGDEKDYEKETSQLLDQWNATTDRPAVQDIVTREVSLNHGGVKRGIMYWEGSSE